MGARLRRLREDRRLTQIAASKVIGLSPSYYNQLENDERPVTAAVLRKIATAFGVDAHVFSDEVEAHLIAELRDALTAAAPSEPISAVELRELAIRQPSVARALTTMHRRLREVTEIADVMADRLGAGPPDVASAS